MRRNDSRRVEEHGMGTWLEECGASCFLYSISNARGRISRLLDAPPRHSPHTLLHLPPQRASACALLRFWLTCHSSLRSSSARRGSWRVLGSFLSSRVMGAGGARLRAPVRFQLILWAWAVGLARALVGRLQHAGGKGLHQAVPGVHEVGRRTPNG